LNFIPDHFKRMVYISGSVIC